MSLPLNSLLGCVVISGCLFLSTTASAADVKMYRSAPSAEEMGNILFSSDENVVEKPVYSRTRSINFSKKKTEPEMQDTAVKSLTADSTPKLAEKPKTIGLPIKFSKNSSNILDESLSFLNELGKMLTMEKHKNNNLLIEGHTDSSGSKNYNMYLSSQRANSVKQYLQDHYQISSSRLSTQGKGESEPLSGSNPRDAVNRRVQFYKAN
ncbi:MAG: OmpA family protein [Pseudomonadota bacterium]